ncbi:hypothetical protein GWI33_012405, partial [Rhynchophorus ferrugineus]
RQIRIKFYSRIAECNDITFSYELINEEGPLHNTVFTIAFYLGNEN